MGAYQAKPSRVKETCALPIQDYDGTWNNKDQESTKCSDLSNVILEHVPTLSSWQIVAAHPSLHVLDLAAVERYHSHFPF